MIGSLNNGFFFHDLFKVKIQLAFDDFPNYLRTLFRCIHTCIYIH